MSKSPIIKRSLDRIIAPEDWRQLDLDIRENPRIAPTVGIFDAPIRCYIINHEWDAHISGAISALAEWRAWVGDDDERSVAVQEILKLLGRETSCDMSIQLRQNPDDACIMEQSFDGGDSWSTAFDYGLCSAISSGNQALNDAIDKLEALLEGYDGNVDSVAPDMVYDSTDTDNIRDLALCHAVQEMIEIICQLELEYRKVPFFTLTVLGAIGALIGIAITIGTLGTGTPLYIAISGSIAGAVGSVFGSLSDAILKDSGAKADVACCMYNALKGATLTKTNFEESLDACAFTGGSNEAQLAGAISGWLSNDDVYESFLDYMQRGYKFAELGIVDCPCETGDTTYYLELDLTATQGNTVDNSGQAVWVSGTGWTEQTAGSISRCYINMSLATEYRFLNSEFRFTKTPSTGNGLRGISWFNDVTELDGNLFTSGTSYPSPVTHDFAGDEPNVDFVSFIINSSGGASDIVMDRIRITIVHSSAPTEFYLAGWTDYTP